MVNVIIHSFVVSFSLSLCPGVSTQQCYKQVSHEPLCLVYFTEHHFTVYLMSIIMVAAHVPGSLCGTTSLLLPQVNGNVVI